jgi:hypothetical protein
MVNLEISRETYLVTRLIMAIPLIKYHTTRHYDYKLIEAGPSIGNRQNCS